MDATTGVARIRHEGREETIYLGHGAEAVATSNAASAKRGLQRRSLEQQTQIDREAVAYAEQLSRPDPDALRRTYELSLRRRERLVQQSADDSGSEIRRFPQLIDAPAANVENSDAPQ
jgi:hypothetical protein